MEHERLSPEEVETAAHESDGALRELLEDFGRCEEEYTREKSDFWRRQYIRTAFAMLEGWGSLLRQKAIEAMKGKTLTNGLNITRFEFLGDSSYTIDRQGKIEPKQQLIPTVNCLAFTLRTLAEESGVEATFFTENGWNEFQQAIKIRNRLTHPKNKLDVDVNDADCDLTYSALRWFFNSVVHIMSHSSIWQDSVAKVSTKHAE